MRLFLATGALVCFVAYLSRVEAVDCEKAYQCAKTDMLTGACEKSKCKCVEGYTATSWGCAKNQAKPEISTGSNFAEAFESSEVILTCAGGTGVYSYAWYKDGGEDPLSDETGVTLTFTMSASDEAYQCALKVDDVLVSKKSDKVTIKVLNDENAQSAAKPVVTLSSPSVAEGKDFDVICEGRPFGLLDSEISLTDEDDQELGNSITQPSSTEDKKVICAFEKDSYEFSNRGEHDFPKVAEGIESVSIKSAPVISSDAVFRVGTVLKLTCETSPVPVFLPEGDITYKWNKDGAPAEAEWTLDGQKGVYNDVTCTAAQGTGDDASSETSSKYFNIRFEDDSYLAAPKVIMSPREPYLHGQVVLTCNTSATDVIVSWTMDGTALQGRTGKTLMFNDLTADLMTVSCEISKNYFRQESTDLEVRAKDAPSAPEIQGENQVGKGGALTLRCVSGSAGQGMTYSWTKDEKALENANRAVFTREEAQDKDAGKYKCQQKYGELGAQTSAEFEVKVVAAGIPCESDNQCDGKEKSLTGVCDTETKRCVCAKHFIAKGNKCENGVSQLAASILIVLVAALFSRLF